MGPTSLSFLLFGFLLCFNLPNSKTLDVNAIDAQKLLKLSPGGIFLLDQEFNCVSEYKKALNWNEPVECHFGERTERLALVGVHSASHRETVNQLETVHKTEETNGTEGTQLVKKESGSENGSNATSTVNDETRTTGDICTTLDSAGCKNLEEREKRSQKYEPVLESQNHCVQPILSEEEPQISDDCVSDLFRFSRSLHKGELWALHMLDAMGKPSTAVLELQLKWLGNSEQCNEIVVSAEPSVHGKRGFRGQYFNAKLGLASSSYDLKPFSMIGTQPGFGIFGTCLPDSCSTTDVTLLVKKGLRRLQLGHMFVPYWTDRLHPDRDQQFTFASYLAIAVTSMLVGLVIISTAMDAIFLLLNKRNKNLKDPSKTDDQGLTLQMLRCFSLYENGPKILATEHSKESVTSIHGLRSVSTLMILFTHAVYYLVFTSANLKRAIHGALTYKIYDVIKGNCFTVDTFFFLGGFLVAFNKTGEMMKKGVYRVDWWKFYIHRFLRINASVMFLILLHTGLLRFFHHSSTTTSILPTNDQSVCEQQWWMHLLGIVNFFSPHKMCMFHLWYVAVDMQCFVLSPLLFIPLYINTKKGTILCLLMLLVCGLYNAIMTLKYNFILADFLAVHEDGSPFQMQALYFFTVARAGVYIIGLLFGYYLAKCNGRITMTPRTVALGWFAAISVLLNLQIDYNEDTRGENVSSLWFTAVFKAVSRSLWGVAIGWIVVACHSGYGGIVNKFLSWKPFIVFSRLSFVVYISHMDVYHIILQQAGTYIPFTHWNNLSFFITAFVISSLFALAVECLCGIPIMELEKVLSKRRKETYSKEA